MFCENKPIIFLKETVHYPSNIDVNMAANMFNIIHSTIVKIFYIGHSEILKRRNTQIAELGTRYFPVSLVIANPLTSLSLPLIDNLQFFSQLIHSILNIVNVL